MTCCASQDKMTSVASKHVFSTVGDTVTVHRATLNPVVDMLILVKTNMA